MKHLMFLLTALIFAVATSTAQTTQVATLSHEGTISTFYSANALKNAYEKAVDGDIITLSSGTFLPVSELKKNITIRGAGMELENNPTIISGDFYLNNTATETNSITLEGLYVNGTIQSYYTNVVQKDVRIIKCYIKSVINLKLINFTIVNCKIDYTHIDNNSNSSGNCINCYLGTLRGGNSPISYTNCVIVFDYNNDSSSRIDNVGNASLKNCIIKTIYQNSMSFASSTTLINCYHFGSATDPFKNTQSKTNVKLESTPFANDEWELTEEAKTVCVGDDGTEAGMYGGLLPFDPTPTNPQITKFNVASKTTADGKLSVDIEVKANN